jgi:hypothetical protein
MIWLLLCVLLVAASNGKHSCQQQLSSWPSWQRTLYVVRLADDGPALQLGLLMLGFAFVGLHPSLATLRVGQSAMMQLSCTHVCSHSFVNGLVQLSMHRRCSASRSGSTALTGCGCTCNVKYPG